MACVLNEKVKKNFKIVVIIVGVLFLWGVFNLFTGVNKNSHHNLEMSMMEETINVDDVEVSGEQEVVADRMTNKDYAIGNSSKSMNVLSPVVNQVVDKKVIKNGNLNLKVEKVAEATEEISEIVQGLGGEIFATNFSERIKGQRRGNLTIKVPVVKFSEAISKIKNVATQVINETTTGRDVTEQYADLQVQLRNKRAEELSFVKILDRSGKIDDVLAVTKQIARVRGEIERLQRRIKYINSQTEMSTITVSLSEDVGTTLVSDNWRPWQTVKKSFQELINNIQDFVDGIIRFLIVGIPSLIPFLLFLTIVYWGVRKIYIKIKA